MSLSSWEVSLGGGGQLMCGMTTAEKGNKQWCLGSLALLDKSKEMYMGASDPENFAGTLEPWKFGAWGWDLWKDVQCYPI